MDSNQWAKELGGLKAMAEIGPSTSSRGEPSSEKKVRPHKDQVVNCPRCNSTNTKFCYYNNYSLTQPRYFCKTCRRYWTEGGTLRNVPVGGGSRKNRRSNTSTSSPATTQKTTTTTTYTQYISDTNQSNISHFSSSNSNGKIHQGHDLNLATFPYTHYGYQFPPQVQLFEFPKYNESNSNILPELKPPATSNSTPFAALELLRNGFSSSSGMNNSHITTATASTSNGIHNTGFLFQDLNPGLSFSVDHRFGSSSRYNGENGIQENNDKMMFHMEEAMKQRSEGRSDGGEQNKGQEISNGCWNGMLGGGQW